MYAACTRTRGRIPTSLSGHYERIQLESCSTPTTWATWSRRWSMTPADGLVAEVGHRRGTNPSQRDSATHHRHAYAWRAQLRCRAALNAMVKGATQTETGHGLEIERSTWTDSSALRHAGSSTHVIDYSIGAGDPRVRHRRLLHRPVASALVTTPGCDHDARGANWEYC